VNTFENSTTAPAADVVGAFYRVINFGQIASKCDAIFKLGGDQTEGKTYAYVVPTNYPD